MTSFVVLCVFLVVFWLCGQLGVPFLGVALFTSGGSGRSCFVCGHVRSFVSAIACRRASLRWLHHSRVVGTAIMRGQWRARPSAGDAAAWDAAAA